jgi:hypothetical protein
VPKRCPLLEPGQAAPRSHQGFLGRVLGVLERAKHPIAVQVHRTLVIRGDQGLEGPVIPGPSGREQLLRIGSAGCDHAHQARLALGSDEPMS